MALPKVILGAGAIGDAVDPVARFTTPEITQSYINTFRSYGHNTIDAARAYSPHCPGTCEPLLGATDFASWAIMDTKVPSPIAAPHTKANVHAAIDASLAALKVDKVHAMYLHAIDRNTSFEETCEAMDEAFRAGKFEKFGLSNATGEDIEQFMEICGRRGFVKPGLYQGMYNALCRGAEEELLPVLRKYEIPYYAYSPTAGGLFSGKLKTESVAKGGRFDKDTKVGGLYRSWYFHDTILNAASEVHTTALAHNTTGIGAALRWLRFNSHLDGSKGDGLILSASSIEQIEQNLKWCDEGPLPQEVLESLEKVWVESKPYAPPCAWAG
ncbi:aflatoxin B1 aldehyde reductase member 2 [Aulographum hederae CBS 113979]|uniref:Aflatoxin B1 aldehyde reductase member 2 n=1 Tax=Aulographum hederae CBS 113979 TaxID=1176131 RepID=A0A6G1HFE4_9PEZI|nr:aflatoxin B1 aldehyde reductase member 2 [Aulographum hederae CBS 113979]